ncbi:MAG: hypothetical protein KGN76_07790 [Acidobacteriota bacterium]|nr:hypothetical protein [Acidobacteriota bacterium]
MKKPAAFLLGVALALAAPRAGAQTVSLTLHDGLATLDAKGATPRQIMEAWEKVGHTKVINADKVVSAPLTLQLQNVPERQALDLVLRSAAGYMAAPRASYLAGASVFDRVYILASSTAPVVPARPAAEDRPSIAYPPGMEGMPERGPIRFFRPRMPTPNGQNPSEEGDQSGDSNNEEGGGSVGNPTITAPIVTPMPGVIVQPPKTEKKPGGGIGQ